MFLIDHIYEIFMYLNSTDTQIIYEISIIHIKRKKTKGDKQLDKLPSHVIIFTIFLQTYCLENKNVNKRMISCVKNTMWVKYKVLLFLFVFGVFFC